MNLLGYDYFQDRETLNSGLSRLAPLIAKMRLEARNCLLFDNGDFLQGSPCGDYLSECHQGTDDNALSSLHPMIRALNGLNYDSATIGNHDFAFGGEFLLNALHGAEFPIISSNLSMPDAAQILPRAILKRVFTDDAGASVELKIGVLGFLPPQTSDWNNALRDRITIEDILDAARREAALLRAEGADLIVALAHSGIGQSAPLPRMENAATALAALPDIDVVVAGHIHRTFPSADFPAGPDIDPVAGTLCGKPAVMPGFWGSHLGVIDLSLTRDAEGWRIVGHNARALPVDPAHAPDPAMMGDLAVLHRHTLAHLDREIGQTATPLNSFFALLGQDAGLNLINAAQAQHVRRALANGPYGDLPVLSVASPSRAGGRGGPDHYTDVRPGPLTLRSLADLYSFANRLCAIRVSGAELCDWLERSAGIFRQIEPGQDHQPLIEPEFPAYNFDVISGLDWTIDLSQPPRYSPHGDLLAPQSRRITSVKFLGHDIDPDQEFIIATNSYRLSEYGLFAPLGRIERLVLDGEVSCRDVLRNYVGERQFIAISTDLGFRFAPINARVTFNTSPRATDFTAGIAHLSPEVGPLTPLGFRRFHLSL